MSVNELIIHGVLSGFVFSAVLWLTGVAIGLFRYAK
jgi:hypothetical protein